jgi:hypothetical protein
MNQSGAVTDPKRESVLSISNQFKKEAEQLFVEKMIKQQSSDINTLNPGTEVATRGDQ